MSSYSPLPPVGTIVKVGTIRPAEPFEYQYMGWRIAAETDVPVPGSSNGRNRVVGKIPIDEISPYRDFDPARRDRAKALRRKMCDRLVYASDRRCLVLHCDPTTGEVVLSLKQAVVNASTVSRTEHKPPYVAHGFRELRNLHRHVLKHALGLGEDTADWPTLLGLRYVRQGLLDVLKNAGCPAALEYDGKTTFLRDGQSCPCPLKTLVECFKHLGAVRRPYEQQTVACIAQASDSIHPRHYHYTARDTGEAVLVFMDERCCKVVAKGQRGLDVDAVTFFQVEYCDPAASDARLKYEKERRMKIARIPSSGRTVCTWDSWGYNSGSA